MAGDLAMLCCISGCKSLAVRVRSSQGLSTMPPMSVPGHVDLEDMVGLRDMAEDRRRSARRTSAAAAASRSGAGVARGDDNALVLLRRQFALGVAVEKVDAAQDDRGEDQGDRHGVQAAVQLLFIASMQLIEAPVDEVRPACAPSRAIGA